MRTLTTTQLRSALKLSEQIETLEKRLSDILGDSAPTAGKRHKMSAAGRRKIAAAQKARWAKAKGKKKRTMSRAARAKIAAAAKERWKKAKAAGKTTL